MKWISTLVILGTVTAVSSAETTTYIERKTVTTETHRQPPEVVDVTVHAPATAPAAQGDSAIERGMTTAGRKTGEALNTAAGAVGRAFESTGEWLQEKSSE